VSLASLFDSQFFVRYTYASNVTKSSAALSRKASLPAVPLLPHVSSPKGMKNLAG
jgi:hypothetical protein